MSEIIQESLSGLREALRADGADIELVDVSDDAVRLQLLLTDEACAECIMPRPTLERILLSAIQQRVPQIHRVELLDPRETQG